MIRIFNMNEIPLEEILRRDCETCTGVEKAVAAILEDVKNRGDAALFAYAQKFDGVQLAALEVPKEALEAASKRIDPRLLDTFKKAKDNIEAFHKNQLRTGFTTQGENGIILGQRITPIEKVGLYVPGGTAAYPSSVLMNAVPAKLAGVKELVIATPPDKNGGVPDMILAAAQLAGVDRVFCMGGAQAIAALAYGTESVPKVYKITGPGNAYVAEAKKQVFGLVDIDMIAGPSEILVIADASADARRVAADMLSQAEHDKMATAVLVTDDKALALAVAEELEKQIPALPRKEICRASVDENGKIILVENLKEAVRVSNRIAPEHLELCVKDPFALLEQVESAGSVFLGMYAPEALGDYWAGPNHVLPTGGTAHFSSPLSVDAFVKKSSFLYYTPEALKNVRDDVERFANAEGLAAHAKSIASRFEGGEKE